jgi:hypothetical protein
MFAVFPAEALLVRLLLSALSLARPLRLERHTIHSPKVSPSRYDSADDEEKIWEGKEVRSPETRWNVFLHDFFCERCHMYGLCTEVPL